MLPYIILKYQRMGSKFSSGKKALSRDQQRLHAYYQPVITEKKLQVLEGHAKKQKVKYIAKAFVLGFALEYFIGVSKIYDNVNTKATLRRLSNFNSMFRCQTQRG